MLYSLYVGAGFPVGGYVSPHIIHQEVLSSQLNKSAGAFLFPAGGSDIYFFCIVAHDTENVNRFWKI